MCRFASEILSKMRVLTKELEVVLGPDTGMSGEPMEEVERGKSILLRGSDNVVPFSNFLGDLELRIGIHSGPVTAGCLRGERTRFQLFGGKYKLTHCVTSFFELSWVPVG